MYRLLVNTNTDLPHNPALDRWEEVDLAADTVIALTLQANDIGDLKTRQSNRSNQLKLPCTPHNNGLFGIADDPKSLTDKPYRYLDCRLYADGVELVGAGGKLELREVDDFHNATIYSGLFTFFDATKDRKLRELDLSNLLLPDPASGKPIRKNLSSVAWDVTSVANTSLNDDVLFPLISWDDSETKAAPGYIFSFADTTEDAGTPDERRVARTAVEAGYILPAVKYHSLLEAVCQNHGYTLEMDKSLMDDTEGAYRRLAVPVANAKPSETDINRCTDAHYTDAKGQTIGENQVFYRFAKGNMQSATADSRLSIHPTNPEWLVLTPIASGNYTITFSFNVTDVGSKCTLVLAVAAMNSDGSQGARDKDEEVDPNANNRHHAHTYTLNLTKNQPMMIAIHARHYSGWFSNRYVTLNNLDIALSNPKLTSPVFPSVAFPIAPNLPELSQSDLIKAACQLFALTVDVDDERKIVRFQSYKTLYDNLAAGNIKDWSHKLDDCEHKHLFKWSSYGQKNTIKYKEDEDGAGIKLTNEGYFSLDDHTLPPEKNLFELPFAAGEDHSVCNLTLANIRLFKSGAIGNDTKPKLVYVEKRDSPVRFKRGEKNEDRIDLNIHYCARFQPLNLQDTVGREYRYLSQGLLRRAHVIIEKLLLQPTDIAGFDHSVPIFLSKYATCFYVNKAINYVDGRLTQVELVALRPLQ